MEAYQFRHYDGELSTQQQVLGDMLNSTDPVKQTMGHRVQLVLDHLEAHYRGPRISVCRGFGWRVTLGLMRIRPMTHMTVLLPLGDKQFHVTIPFLTPQNPWPWTGEASFNVRGCAEAAILLTGGLAEIFRFEKWGGGPPRYINRNPAVTVQATDGCVRCPHCEVEFPTSDESVWDGQRHLICQQRLEITADRG